MPTSKELAAPQVPSRLLQVGDMVCHAQYGQGRVLRLLGNGQYFVHFFSDRVNQYCRADDLRYYLPDGRLIAAAQPRTRWQRYAGWREARPRGAEALPPGPEGEWAALRILEAMRTGVVGERVELYTTGRQLEMERLEEDLGRLPEGGARVFLGDYGAGKTHMLECLEAKALGANCLTARIALNSKDTSPSNPQRVYRALMLNLIYPGHSGKDGLWPLFLEARRRGLVSWWLERQNFHAYLSPALYFFNRYLDNLEACSDPQADRELDRQEGAVRHLLDWLEGQEAQELTGDFNRYLGRIFPGAPSAWRFPALKDYRTFGHIYTYILSAIARLARQAGYAGLVLLLDEAEMYNILSSRDRNFADQLFGYYAALALGKEAVPGIARFPRGGHPNHRHLPPLYNPEGGKYESGVFCAFAMTMDRGAGWQALQELLPQEVFWELQPLSKGDYRELCSLVIGLYRRAYPQFACGDNAAAAMGQVVYQAIEQGAIDGSRQLLRCILELLDYSRLCRGDIGPYVHEMTSKLHFK